MEKHMLEASKAMARREDEHAREKEHCARLLIAATKKTTTTAGIPAPTRRISFADEPTNRQPEQRQPDQSSSANARRGANGGDDDDEGDDDDDAVDKPQYITVHTIRAIHSYHAHVCSPNARWAAAGCGFSTLGLF